jgi:hypothetical protein
MTKQKPELEGGVKRDKKTYRYCLRLNRGDS